MKCAWRALAFDIFFPPSTDEIALIALTVSADFTAIDCLSRWSLLRAEINILIIIDVFVYLIAAIKSKFPHRHRRTRRRSARSGI